MRNLHRHENAVLIFCRSISQAYVVYVNIIHSEIYDTNFVSEKDIRSNVQAMS